jgi:hypothetical protein
MVGGIYQCLTDFLMSNFLAEQVTIPFEISEDKRIWQPSNNGVLTFKKLMSSNMVWVKISGGLKIYGALTYLQPSHYWFGESCITRFQQMKTL